MAADAPPRLVIGGVPVDPVTLAGALARVEALVAAGRGGAVFTPNVDHVVVAQRDPAFRAAYAAADLSLADGMPIVWSSRLLGVPLPERVAGSDLVLPLAGRAAALGWRLYLMGGRPGAARGAAERLQRELPDLRLVGAEAPQVRLDGPDPEGDAAVERIRAARPQILLVALGAPKQERWIHRHLDALRPTVAVGVGASLDFLAGLVPRAPRWMSRAGLEWLWRLAQDPRRLWRRYLVEDAAFAAILARELRARRRRG